MLSLWLPKVQDSTVLYLVKERTDVWFVAGCDNDSYILREIKGENDMFDVSKIKLGDYVETRDSYCEVD